MEVKEHQNQDAKGSTESEDEISIPNNMIHNCWRLERKLGSGAFGIVYLATDIHTGQKVAVKLEEDKKKNRLQPEFDIYKVLAKGAGIPEVYWCGKEGKYNVLVMEVLDRTLKQIFEGSDRKFSLRTILLIGDKLLEILENIHSRGYIYRDVKPQNFMTKVGDPDNIYIVDFGLSKKYRVDGEHIPYCDNKKGITGTSEYVSLNTHQGIDQSRRDDLESVGYMILYFLKGALPWGRVRKKIKNKKEQNEKIMGMKTDIKELCEGLDAEFLVYFNYTRSLLFEEKPDYSFLRKLFACMLRREGSQGSFEWLMFAPSTPIHTSEVTPRASSLVSKAPSLEKRKTEPVLPEPKDPPKKKKEKEREKEKEKEKERKEKEKKEKKEKRSVSISSFSKQLMRHMTNFD